jgi:aspartyl-tRNA(Asn)/glutamyl-tRNA(Gln) amidotransferase subunit A
MSKLNELTISQAHQGLKNKEFSSLELTTSCLEHIKKTDKNIKAFISLREEEALKSAKQVDQKTNRGDSISQLAGIPYAAKDIFCTLGTPTTAGSKILKDYIPPFESTTTQRLLAQDAILIGKTNLDEFAMGSSTENSGFFPTKNPHDLTRVPGGSSGGSAAAVAAHQSIYALGTDTGGSIRQPAALCGTVGLKPTYGRTSRYGVVAFASSLDTIGHLTKTVEDAAIVLDAIAGHDERDSTSSNLALDNYSKEILKSVKGLKIGIPKEYFERQGLDEEVKKSIEQAIQKIEELCGQPVVQISLPHTDYALACYYIIMPAEASSNLARYDSIKYGFSLKAKDLLTTYLETRAEGFGEEVKRRIILGTYALSHGYYDAYYKKALQVRTLIKKDFMLNFKKVDIILAPTTPSAAFKLGEKIDSPLQMYLSDIYTIPVNLAGLPALSIPVGKTKDNLPIGLQIIGRWFDEKTILRLGYNYEKAGK